MVDTAKVAEFPGEKRWRARIFYDDLGFPNGGHTEPWIEYDFEELRELHEIVEGGPNFYSIAKIEIVINPAVNSKAMVPVGAQISRSENRDR